MSLHNPHIISHCPLCHQSLPNPSVPSNAPSVPSQYTISPFPIHHQSLPNTSSITSQYTTSPSQCTIGSSQSTISPSRRTASPCPSRRPCLSMVSLVIWPQLVPASGGRTRAAAPPPEASRHVRDDRVITSYSCAGAALRWHTRTHT